MPDPQHPTQESKPISAIDVTEQKSKFPWPSRTDTHFPLVIDDEGRKRAAALAAATFGNAGSPLQAISTYRVGRVAAGTPDAQPADLRGLERGMPADMPDLIDRLLSGDSRNRGIAFGDTNHYERNLPALLTNPRVIEALKRNGVTHVFVETTPELLEDTSIPGGILVARARAAGIEVVPMDMLGPATQAKIDAKIKFIKAVADGDPDAIKKMMADKNKDMHALLTERIRVTNAVWVERIVETMKAHPKGKFIVFGGDAHINNPVTLNAPDINHSDLDESLAHRLNAPVPYVRIRSDSAALAPRIVPGGHPLEKFPLDQPDTPEATVHAPEILVQGANELFRTRSKEEQLNAAIAACQYEKASRNFVTGMTKIVTNDLRSLEKRMPGMRSIACVEQINELAAQGKVQDARRILTNCGKDFANYAASQDWPQGDPLAPTPDAQVQIEETLKEARQHLAVMRRSLEAFDRLHEAAGRPVIHEPEPAAPITPRTPPPVQKPKIR